MMTLDDGPIVIVITNVDTYWQYLCTCTDKLLILDLLVPFVFVFFTTEINTSDMKSVSFQE